jgi:hypothetical protein
VSCERAELGEVGCKIEGHGLEKYSVFSIRYSVTVFAVGPLNTEH